jgi:preprotein translocase SecE subunit
MTHAAPDAELAEAQLALGRPDLAEQAPEELEPADRDDAQDLDEAPQELDEPAEEFGEAPDVPGVFPQAARVQRGRVEPEEFDEAELAEVAEAGDGSSAAVAAPSAPVPAPRARLGNRLLNFLQGSWRELQRVQWPDRRQVMQATGVVIGFVIVAGLFLGLADTLSAKLMNFILK